MAWPFSRTPKRSWSAWDTLGAVLLLAIVATVLIAFLPGVNGGRHARRPMCSNNLKQIGLAIHNYADVYGSIPAARAPEAAGGPPISWRLRMAAFTDYAHLWKAYDVSQPWNSEANQKLGLPIALFSCPSHPHAPNTSYVALVDRDSLIQPTTSRPRAALEANPDKIIVVEAADSGIEWTEPRDLTLGQFIDHMLREQPHPGGFNALTANGAVQFIRIPDDATREQLESLLRPMMTIEP